MAGDPPRFFRAGLAVLGRGMPVAPGNPLCKVRTGDMISKTIPLRGGTEYLSFRYIHDGKSQNPFKKAIGTGIPLREQLPGFCRKDLSRRGQRVCHLLAVYPGPYVIKQDPPPSHFRKERGPGVSGEYLFYWNASQRKYIPMITMITPMILSKTSPLIRALSLMVFPSAPPRELITIRGMASPTA